VAVLSIAMLSGAAEARPRAHGRRLAHHEEAHVPPGLRVSVQPIVGDSGPGVRGQIARLLRGHGCRVVTSLPRVEGTSQYLTMAKDNRLAAFVAADLEEGAHWNRVTFLVWDGASGNVLGRWTASAAPKNLAKTIAKGFWKNLGPQVSGATTPPSEELGEAPPMYVNAGEPLK
jgi:hypothetical protein